MKAPKVDGQSRQSAVTASQPQAFVLWTILSLGQAQIEHGKSSEIDEVFTELDELDRQERNR